MTSIHSSSPVTVFLNMDLCSNIFFINNFSGCIWKVKWLHNTKVVVLHGMILGAREAHPHFVFTVIHTCAHAHARHMPHPQTHHTHRRAYTNAPHPHTLQTQKNTCVSHQERAGHSGPGGVRMRFAEHENPAGRVSIPTWRF